MFGIPKKVYVGLVLFRWVGFAVDRLRFYMYVWKQMFMRTYFFTSKRQPENVNGILRGERNHSGG